MSDGTFYSDLYVWGPAEDVAAQMASIIARLNKESPVVGELFGSVSGPVTAQPPWPIEGVIQSIGACYPHAQIPTPLIGDLLGVASTSANVVVVLIEWSDDDIGFGASARHLNQNGETYVGNAALLQHALGKEWFEAIEEEKDVGEGDLGAKLLDMALTHPALLRVLAPWHAKANAQHLEQTFAAAATPKSPRF